MTARLLTAAELAEHLRLKPATVRLMARRGDIPGRRIGGRVVDGRIVGGLWRFEPAAVEQALANTDPWAAPQRGRRRAS